MRELKRYNRNYIKSRKSEWKLEFVSIFVSGSSIHPRCDLYKYYFWVYPENSEYENASFVFFKDEHRLSIKDAMNLVEKYKDENISYIYANIRLRRLGCSLWGYERIKNRFPDESFAPAYDDDMDEEWEGHK